MRWLFQIVRRVSRWRGGRWFSWLFARTSALLPVRRLYRSRQLLVIRHPRPAYPFHALIIPREAISGLEELDATHAGLLLDILQTAARLASESDLVNYRIVVNGGEYQNLPQLHFHLISD